jgi:hypothetical protein
MLNLFASGPFGMVFKHLLDCFHLKDLRMDPHNCFNFAFILHKVTLHIKLHISLGQPAF